jgi:hypothetical protein
MHGNPVRGVIRVPISTRGEVGSLVIEKLPAEAWAALPAGRPDALAEAVRAKFDPSRLLNPDILGAAA